MEAPVTLNSTIHQPEPLSPSSSGGPVSASTNRNPDPLPGADPTAAPGVPDWWVAGPGVLYCRDCYREQAAIYGIAYACPPDVPLEDEEARCISCHRRPCPTCGLRIVNPGDEENGSDECGHCLLTTYTSRTWRVDVLAYHDHVEMAERWLRRHDELPNNGHWPSAMRTAFWREVETWAGKAAVEAFLIGERCGDSREQRREIPAELVRRTVASERVLALLRNEVARITR